MRIFLTLCLSFFSLACLADGPVVQTTPLTRQLLRASDTGTARSVLGVLATNNWPVTNVTLYTPALQGGTSSGMNSSNPTNNGGVYTNGNFNGGNFQAATNNYGVFTNGTYSGGIFNAATNNNPQTSGGAYTGGNFSNGTNILNLPATSMTNSAIMSFGAATIPASYFQSTLPTPLLGWATSGSSYDLRNEARVFTLLTNFDNSPYAHNQKITFDIDDGWQATNGTIYDANGILQVNTNLWPHGLAYIVNAIHAHGYKAMLFIQCGTYSDSGPPFPAVISNYYGNVIYAITNYGFDSFRGHGDWGKDPQTAFDQEIEAALACVNSGTKAFYIPQSPTGVNQSPLLYYFAHLTPKFFPAYSVISGSGFGDFQGDLPTWRSAFNYCYTNFSFLISPGHSWEQINVNWNPTTVGDNLWRYDKVGSTMNAMASSGFIFQGGGPNNPLYQGAQMPLDVINRVDQDPLMALPTLALGTYSSDTNVWLKQLQGGETAIAVVNWNTNSSATVSFTPQSLGISTNCSGFMVHDCWGNNLDYFLPVGGSITNSLQAPDACVLVLTPQGSVPSTTFVSSNNFVNPLYSGMILDVPLIEGPGSTSIASYASLSVVSNYWGIQSQPTPSIFGTASGTVFWDKGQVGNSIRTTNFNVSPSSPGSGNYFTLPGSSFASLSNFTFECTFREYTFTSNYAVVFEIGSPGVQIDLSCFLNSVNSTVCVQMNGVAVNQATASASFDDGNWHDFSVTYDGAHVISYIDGTQLASTAYSSPWVHTSGANIFYGDMYSGNVGPLRFWNRALNATEIKLLYRQSFPP
jgi:hypothetical protein